MGRGGRLGFGRACRDAKRLGPASAGTRLSNRADTDPHPVSYTHLGFSPEKVAEYMRQSFDLLLNARDPEIGYPADDNRLVQRLLWYSLSDTNYPTGNLVDPVSGELTLLGEAFAEYVDRLDAPP